MCLCRNGDATKQRIINKSMYNNLLNQVGKEFRRITFSLQKDSDYYVIFSVLELLEEDMQDFSAYPSSEDGKPFIMRASTTSEANEYNVYFTIDRIQLTEQFVHDPKGNYVINGVKFKFFNSNYALRPNLEYSYLLKDSFHDDAPTIQKVLPLRQCSKWLSTYIDTTHSALDILKSFEYLQIQVSQLSVDAYGADLMAFPEHIGNIYIVRYNPYIRKIHFTISPAPNPGLFCHYFFRNAIDDTLKIKITNKTRGGFLLSEDEYPVDTKQVEQFYPMKTDPDVLDVKIVSENEGPVFFDSDMHFVSKIEFNMNVKTADVEMKIKSKEGEEEQHLEKFVSESHSIGTATEREAALGERSSENAYKILEDNLEFILFDGDKNKKEENTLRAREAIRRILEKAQKRCIICDPYFGQKDIADFVFPMTSLNVNVRILAGKENLAKTSEEGKKIAAAIQSMLDEFNKRLGSKIQMRLLTGQSILHDRFIIVDDLVWLLGSSFNQFGSRATTIVKVPTVSCKNFYGLAEKWWSDDKETISLTDYERS